MLRLSIGYPKPEAELELLRRKRQGTTVNEVRQVVSHEGLQALRGVVEQIHIADEVLAYLVQLVGATRGHSRLLQGASPRATLALASMSRAYAFIHDRDYVLPEDVAAVFADTVTHRLLPAPGADAAEAVQDVLHSVRPPKIR